MKKIICLTILSLLVLAGFSCSEKANKNNDLDIVANENSLNQETPNEQPKSEEKNEENISEKDNTEQENIEVNNDENNDSQLFNDRQKVENQQETKDNDNTQKQEKQILVNLIIDFATRQKTLSASLQENATVYDLLQKLQSDGKINFSAKNYSFGVLVEEIGGVKNSEKDKKYWMLYVNDKLSEVGASGKKLNNGDKVLWKYEKQ